MTLADAVRSSTVLCLPCRSNFIPGQPQGQADASSSVTATNTVRTLTASYPLCSSNFCIGSASGPSRCQFLNDDDQCGEKIDRIISAVQ
jgi:hypothetical protein